MSRATCKSELPKPQKALTKLTKAPRTTPFVSFVSGFLGPQIAKTDVLRPSRPNELSFTRRIFHHRRSSRGGRPRVAAMSGRDTPVQFADALSSLAAVL
jgi:hypothetical protein